MATKFVFDVGVKHVSYPAIRNEKQVKRYQWHWLYDDEEGTLCRHKDPDGTYTADELPGERSPARKPPSWDEWPVPPEHAAMLTAWGYDTDKHVVMASYIEDHWPDCPEEFYEIVRWLALNSEVTV